MGAAMQEMDRRMMWIGRTWLWTAAIALGCAALPARVVRAQTASTAEAMRLAREAMLQPQPLVYTEVDTMMVGSPERWPHRIEVTDVTVTPASCKMQWTERDHVEKGYVDTTWTMDMTQFQKFYVSLEDMNADKSRGERSEAYSIPVWDLFLNGTTRFSTRHLTRHVKGAAADPADRTNGLAYRKFATEDEAKHVGEAISRVGEMCSPSNGAQGQPTAASAPAAGTSAAGGAAGFGVSMEQTVDFINQMIAQNSDFRYEVHTRVNGEPFHTTEVEKYGRVELSSACHLMVPHHALTFIYPTSGVSIASHDEGLFNVDLTTADPRKIQLTPREDADTPMFHVGFVAVAEKLPLATPLPIDIPSSTLHDGNETYFVDGIVKSLDKKEFTVLSYETNKVLTMELNRKSIQGSVDGFNVGDSVSVQVNIRDLNKNKITAFTVSQRENKPGSTASINFGFHDKDTAERVSRALIHAMSMCYKAVPEKPKAASIF
jgi:hypothetical protein